MCEHGDTVRVDTPDWFWDSRAIPENGIALDRCIAERIVDAWAAGVRTGGCCCGHGIGAPDVVLLNGEDPALAREHLPGFTLLQWRLTDVTNPHPLNEPGDAT